MQPPKNLNDIRSIEFLLYTPHYSMSSAAREAGLIETACSLSGASGRVAKYVHEFVLHPNADVKARQIEGILTRLRNFHPKASYKFLYK